MAESRLLPARTRPPSMFPSRVNTPSQAVFTSYLSYFLGKPHTGNVFLLFLPKHRKFRTGTHWTMEAQQVCGEDSWAKFHECTAIERYKDP